MTTSKEETEPIGNPIAGLVYTSVAENLLLARRLESNLTQPFQAVIVDKVLLTRIQFSMRSTAELLDKYFRENQHLLAKIEDLSEKLNRATEME